MLLWASIFNVLKSYKMIRIISSLFPYGEENGERTISGKASLFQGVALLAVVLAAVPAAALHFDVRRRSVGGDLRLSGIVRLSWIWPEGGIHKVSSREHGKHDPFWRHQKFNTLVIENFHWLRKLSVGGIKKIWLYGVMYEGYV